MQINILDQDSICALATSAHGTGAIGVIRVSGNGCHNTITPLLTRNGKPFDIDTTKPNKAYFCQIKDGDSVLDEVVTTFFIAPHSYTGEDSVEISCHGSSYIIKRLLEILVEHGIRMAKAGEFTMRAFRNGKFDLSQAEAVADLIAAQSKAAHNIAMQQMRGNYSDKIKGLRQRLVDFTSLIELELDFAEEDVTFADRNEMRTLLSEIKNEVSALLRSFKAGNVIKNGIPTAIVGKPNVGKSTLLNAITNDDKAIVSDIPGTTRDSIEDTIDIEGMRFRFIDTAGLRDKTNDEIEKIGMQRTIKKINEAVIVLYVTTENDFNDKDLAQFADIINDKDRLFLTIFNKSDIYNNTSNNNPPLSISISAKKKIGLDSLEHTLVEFANKISNTNDTIVSNTRHYDALTSAMTALNTIEKGIDNGLSNDLLSIDLHTALNAIGLITGQEITNDEILGTIFGKFCIGK